MGDYEQCISLRSLLQLTLSRRSSLWVGAVLFVTGSFGAVDLRPWIPVMKAKRALGVPVDELAAEHRVVVVMTTIPLRIDSIEPVIDSMLSQTWPIAGLYLSVPNRYNRTGEQYQIPEWLRAKTGVRIVRCHDLGPGTHLLNGLRLERDPWTFMVIVDDDHIYAPELVENLMRSALAYPGSAVAAQGFLSVPGLAIDKSRDTPRYLHDQGFASGPVLVSYLGVVYQRGFFDDSIFDYSSTSRQCMFQDDMWFSAHLAGKGIKRYVLGAALGVQELTHFHLGPSSLTKWKENRPRQVSKECNEGLLRHDPNIWALRRRVVLSLAGLPPMPAQLPGEGETRWDVASGTSASALAWLVWSKQLLKVVQKLPRQPDLVYVCTSFKAGREAASIPGGSFRLGSLLVSPSDACSPDLRELPVGKAMRDPLKWEGDPDTIIVLGTLDDVAADISAFALVASCAARRSMDEDRSRSEGASDRTTKAVFVGLGAGMDADTDHDLPNGRVLQDPSSPFCRTGGLVAASLGAFESFVGQRPAA
eukprot:TRINITY_DN56799_c0_g1_i1.p1 TRINITY_DN56799_c0_g1~~TRINITY_DN56799_c0_g1_i1.p1  ORF type:complete len:532 (-),score=85.85 TRINITY_DN56799_c0_g1_i1:122-1717(-)